MKDNQGKIYSKIASFAVLLVILLFSGRSIFTGSEKDAPVGIVSDQNLPQETNAVNSQREQTEISTFDELQSEQDTTNQQVSSEVQTETLEVPESGTVSYQFRKDQYLTEHFQKHGAEFPYDTEEEYLSGANRVIADPDSLHKLEAEDGDDVYYLERTNEFVIVSTDGYIRTYFKPSSGIAYYNRQ